MLNASRRRLGVSFLLLGPVALAAVAACGSSHADGGTSGTSDCGAIELFPATVLAVNALDGSPVCNPSFAVLSWPSGQQSPEDGGGAVACEPDFTGCPAAPTDGGAAPCEFQLYALTWPGSYSLRVSAPGFEPAVVDDVSPGVGGCVSYVAPSDITVKLSPSADAGDAG